MEITKVFIKKEEQEYLPDKNSWELQDDGKVKLKNLDHKENMSTSNDFIKSEKPNCQLYEGSNHRKSVDGYVKPVMVYKEYCEKPTDKSGDDDTIVGDELEVKVNPLGHFEHKFTDSEVKTECIENTKRVTKKKSLKCNSQKMKKSYLVNERGKQLNGNLYNCKSNDYEHEIKSEIIHQKRKHTAEKSFQCSLCDYQAWRKCDLNCHMRTHTGEKPYQCSDCDYRSSRNSELVRHMRIHTGEKPYHCSVCDYRGSDEKQFLRHMRTHTGEKPHLCTVCDYRSSRKSVLTHHMRTHTGEKPFHCSVCGHRAARKDSFLIHMRTH